MSAQTFARAACLSTVFALSACGGGDGGSGICKAFGGGTSTVTAAPSTGSSITDTPRAFDGSLASFATYTPVAGSGSLTIRGTAQSGVVQPGGQAAGILLTVPTDSQTVQFTITTYLNGAVQATGSPGAQTGAGTGQTCRGICLNQGDQTYYGIDTTAPFDAIEATLQVSRAPSSVQIRELCAR